MFSRRSIARVLSLIMAFTPFGHAETLIGAGRLHDAHVAVAKIMLEQAEDFARSGIAPKDLVGYLSARYSGAADQLYLTEVLAKLSDPTSKVKMRALEKTAHGYVLTTPSGTLLKITKGSKGTYLVNGQTLRSDSLRASVEQIRRALDKKMARIDWPALFGLPSADAATPIEYGMIAALIAVCIVGALKAVVPAKSDAKAETPKPPPVPPGLGRETLAGQLDSMAKTCEDERKEKRAFDTSLTGQTMWKLINRRVVDVTMDTRPGCVAAVDNYRRGEKSLMARGDVDLACSKLDDFLGCVKAYRATALPAASTPRVSGAGTRTPLEDTTPEQPAGATTPSESAH